MCCVWSREGGVAEWMDGMIEKKEVDPSQGATPLSTFQLPPLLPPGHTEIFSPD